MNSIEWRNKNLGESMVGVVFVYAREDAFEAQQMAQRLEQASYPVEVRISLGFGPESFKEHLHSLIGAATGVIVLWSFSSILNPVIRNYAEIAADKGNLVSVLSYQLPWPPAVEGKSPISRYDYYKVPKSTASSLFPPWLTSDNYYVPPPPTPSAPPQPNSLSWAENSSLGAIALFALPAIIIVGSVIWGVARNSLSVELVGWAVLSAALVNLLRGMRA